jgi:hypothetical protein
MREAGTLVLDDGAYKVYRKGRFSGAFILEKDGSVVASATKPSALKRALEVEYGNNRYALKPISSFGRTFVLLDEGTILGTMRPLHAFTRKALVDFPDSIPLPVRIFMVWLTIILWKRDEGAAGAGSGA